MAQTGAEKSAPRQPASLVRGGAVFRACTCGSKVTMAIDTARLASRWLDNLRLIPPHGVMGTRTPGGCGNELEYYNDAADEARTTSTEQCARDTTAVATLPSSQ
jgi:hypothetical protein